eukprot:6651304-Pyramimonas_sp.AAC.1
MILRTCVNANVSLSFGALALPCDAGGAVEDRRRLRTVDGAEQGEYTLGLGRACPPAGGF